MDPIRGSRQVLNEAKAEGDYHYSGQFLQWPIPAGGLMFQTEKIEIMVPPGKHWKQRMRFWDNAATKGGKGAYSVGVEIGRYEDNSYWVLDVVRKRLGTAEREAMKKRTAAADGIDVWIGLEQEPGSGGKDQVDNTIRNLAGYKVRAERPTGDKTTRAIPYSVQVNQGNVKMVPGEWNTAYLNELEFFPESTYKDQVDASSGAFNFLAVGKKRVGAI